MASAVLQHAELHLALISRGSDRYEFEWHERPGEEGKGYHVHYPAQDIGGEVILLVEAKHCAEDIRSALDYVAFEIYERAECDMPVGDRPHEHTKVGFPIPKYDETEERYRAKVSKEFNCLASRSPAAFEEVVRTIEHASRTRGWLRAVHELAISAKHRHLPAPQHRTARIVASGGGVPPNFPPSQVRLISEDPPKELISTLKYGILVSRDIVDRVQRALVASGLGPRRGRSP